MTADVVVLTRPGRLGDLARSPHPPHRWVYVCTCDPQEIHRTILTARAGAEDGSGPLRIGTVLHRAHPPADAPVTLRVLRHDLELGTVLGLEPAGIDRLLADLTAKPTRWLIIAVVRTITPQPGYLARWS